MKTKTVTVLVAMATILAACGGSSNGDSNAQPVAEQAQGFYVGTTSDGRTLSTTILDNNDYYATYSAPNNATKLAGVVAGNLTTSAGTINAGSGIDYDTATGLTTNISLTGSYSPKASISGKIVANGGANANFTGNYDASYDLVPSLAIVQGNYTGTSLIATGSDPVSMTIDANGRITGTGSTTCVVSGSIKPRATGNVYDVSILFGTTSQCAYPAQAATGIARIDASNNELIAMLQTSSKAGILVSATK